MNRRPAVILLAAATALGLGLALYTGTPSPSGGERLPPAEEEEILLPEEDVPLSGAPEEEIEDGGVPLAEGPEAGFAQKVLALVNAARAEAGLEALILDEALCGAAQVRAAECLNSFAHDRPDGSAYKMAIIEAGIESAWTGENLARGHASPEQAVESWLKSEGHRANILNERYTRLGVGWEKNTAGRYKGYTWVQLFAD